MKGYFQFLDEDDMRRLVRTQDVTDIVELEDNVCRIMFVNDGELDSSEDYDTVVKRFEQSLLNMAGVQQ